MTASLSCALASSLNALGGTFNYDCRFDLTRSPSYALDSSLNALGGKLKHGCRFVLTASLSCTLDPSLDALGGAFKHGCCCVWQQACLVYLTHRCLDCHFLSSSFSVWRLRRQLALRWHSLTVVFMRRAYLRHQCCAFFQSVQRHLRLACERGRRFVFG